MAALQDDSVQRVKDAADIVEVIGEHVTLQRAGVRLKGLCPFHSEKTPSFTVNEERQLFHCFGCHESGDVLSFMMKYHNMTFQDALAGLAERYGVVLVERELSPEEQRNVKKRQALHGVNEVASGLFHEFLLKNPAAGKARRYLEERKLSREVISRFQLGYAPDRWDFLVQGLARTGTSQDVGVAAGLLVQKDGGGVYDRFRDRVIFPIFSLSGQHVGFSGRILGNGQPKYLNSPETAVFDKSRTLFGLYQNKEAIRKAGKCLVVEGNFDLLSLVESGIEHVVAPLGTALTAQHVKILKRYTSEVIVLFDGDEAGLKAAMRSVPLFLTEQLHAKIVALPSEHDPDTFLRAFGKEAMEKKAAEAMDLPEFVFARLVNEHGLSLNGKGKIVKELQPLIAAIGNRRLQKSLFVSHFSSKLGLQIEELQGSAEKNFSSRGPLVKKPAKEGLKISGEHRQLLEFLLIYPEALPRFLEAGLEKIIGNENDSVSVIIKHLKKLETGENGINPDVLLEKMHGNEKIFISQVLIDAPSYSDEMREAMIADMVAWVRKQAWQGQKTELLRRINEAQHGGDDQLLMELLEKKKEMDELSYT